MRALLVVAAGFVLALLFSLYEGKRAHALDVGPVSAPIATPTTPVANATTPVAKAAKPVTEATKPVTPVVRPVVDTVQPIVQPVIDTVKPIVQPILQPVVDTLRPVVRPVVDLVSPIVPPDIRDFVPPMPSVPDIAPRVRQGSSPTAVAAVATAVVQDAGDPVSGIVRRFTSAADRFVSLPFGSVALPHLSIPALPVSFPSPVPSSHAPGGLGRTSGGGLAVFLAAAAVASLRGRRFRFATGRRQSILLASLIARPG